MKYRCYECGKTFKEPARNYVISDYWGVPKTDTVKVCPLCGSRDLLTQKYTCALCKEPIFEGDIYYEACDGERYCEDCIEKKEAGD